MAEFNGKYFVDSAHGNGFYRKDGVGDAGSECVVWYSDFLYQWLMGKEDGPAYYFVDSRGDLPPTTGWNVRHQGSGSPPQLVYGGSDVPNVYVILYG